MSFGFACSVNHVNHILALLRDTLQVQDIATRCNI